MPLQDILDAHQLEQLVGVREDMAFEAKRANAYDVTQASGRLELAKDVAGFANSQGGHLVIGLVTTPLAAEQTDEVTALDLMPAGAIQPNQLAAIIRELTHPPIAGLQVTWVASLQDAAMGVVVVRVPPQEEARKWFLIGGTVEEMAAAVKLSSA